MAPESSDIRQKAVRGSIYLTIRQALSVLLGTLGLLLMTRVVGPQGYGTFAAAFGVLRYLILLGEGGVKMYLLRMRPDTPAVVFHQAFCWLAVVSAGFTGVVSVVLAIVASLNAGETLFWWVLFALCLNMPLSMLLNIPVVLLERELNYRALAITEIASQFLYYAVGISMAFAGHGVWAFVGAFWAGQVALFVGVFGAARYRPRWVYETQAIRTLVRESFALASAAFVYELRLLLPSLVLLPLGGAQAVGHYAIAQRLLSTLGFVRDAVARLSVPLYARAQDNAAKLLQLARLSAQAQMLGLFALYLPFTLAGVYILRWIFGEKWNVLLIVSAFGILAANQLFFVIFGAYNQVLIVRKKSHLFLWSGVWYVLLAAVLGYLLPMAFSRLNTVLGFCLALSCAYAPTYYMIMHLGMKRYLGNVEYGINLLLAVGLGLALLTPLMGYPALLGLGVLLLPTSLRQMREILGMLAQARRGE